jgi:adenylate cyclase, class 2
VTPPDRPRREEVEIKLPCRSLDAVRENLRDRRAESLSPLHLETNDLYDDSDGRLAGSGRTLRLRRANGETILTYKGPARFEGGIKTREERETRVSHAGEAEHILAGLGFSPRFRYEKRREEWKLAECTVALDHTPIGDFVEIEGDPSAIRQVVAALELDPSEAIPYSYAKLYALRRQKDPSLPPDMTFPPGSATGSG